MVEREDYNGLYKTNPRLTMVMTLALFSLAGIPPFAGFFSKFFVFAAAFQSGYYLIVFIALVNTIISLYYYLLIVKAMFITPNDEPANCFRASEPRPYEPDDNIIHVLTTPSYTPSIMGIVYEDCYHYLLKLSPLLMKNLKRSKKLHQLFRKLHQLFQKLHQLF